MSEQIISKRCSKCKIIKPVSEFYKQINSKDGYHNQCKTCRKSYDQSENGKRVNNARQKRYHQTEKGRATQSRAVRVFKLKHPEQVKANWAVKTAIRAGKIPQPDSLQCSCGKQAVQYHHHKGYAPEHWLDVIPVCVKCHNRKTYQP